MIYSRFACAVVATAGVATVLAGGQSAARELKSPDVPFVAKNAKRVAAKPAVDANVITFGDRKIVLEPNQIEYFADGAQRFKLWHQVQDKTTRKHLTLDSESCRTAATADGTTVTTRVLDGQKEVGRIVKEARLAADGAVVITFRPDVPKDCRVIYHLRQNTTQMLGKSISCNGKSVTLPNDMPGYLKFRAPKVDSPFTSFACATDEPAIGYTMGFAGIAGPAIWTSRTDFDMRLFTPEDGAPAIVVTFRPVACDARAGDCVLGGINFTAEDNLTVYSGSNGKNLVLDPSFENKMRLHTTRVKEPACRVENGVLKDNDFNAILDRCVNGTMARTGKYSLQPAHGNWLVLKTLPLVKGETYVFSAYVRSTDGKKAQFGITHRINDEYPPIEFPTLKDVDWTKWTRVVSKPFQGMTDRPCLECFAVGGSENLVIDDLQLERGTETTEFAGGELGFEMVTDSPERMICDATKNFHPRVRVSGDRTLKGTLRFTGRDYFDRQLFVVEKPLDFGGRDAASTEPETFVDLPETKNFPLGPVYVRIAFAPEGSDDFVYRDTVRLLNIKYAPANAKWRFLFDTLSNGHWKYTHAQMNALGLIFRHVSGDYCNYWLNDEAAAVKYMKDECVLPNELRGVDWSTAPKYYWTIAGLRFVDREGNDLNYAESYPDYILKEIEDAVAKYVAARPWAPYWIYSSEPSGHHRTIPTGHYDEYAKLVLAAYRGAKRGNPNALFVPVGHCSHMDEGNAVTIPTLKAAQKIAPDVRFGAVGAHCYCDHPEIPDLDKAIAAILRNLKTIGYDDMKLTLDEGGYFVPQRVTAFNFAPWAGTADKDAAGGEVKFSNDAGWAEHVAAAMLMRYYVMLFKYADRILMIRPWVYLGRPEPYAWTAMVNVFHRTLGDSTYVNNFEFAPGARVYFFKDGHGRFVAIPWLFSRELDYGREEGQRMFLPATELGVEIMDMMGNACTAQVKDGTFDLPLNNYPYYLIVDESKAQALMDAFRKVEYTPKADSIPYTILTRPVSTTEYEVDLTNPFASEKRLTVKIGDAASEELVLKQGETKTLKAKFPTPSADGVVNDYVIPIAVTTGGFTSRESLLIRTWNVKRVPKGAVDWSKIPAVRLTGEMPQNWKGENDFSAVCRLAWREGELLVRTEAKDDVFVPSPAGRDKGWSWFMESTQLFFDGFGNGRSNLRNGVVGFDADDFVYDIFATAPDRVKIYRNRVPDQQLTFGLASPKAGTYAEMPYAFEAKDGKRALTVTLTDYDVAPAKINMERPMAFAVMVHDTDDLKTEFSKEKNIYGKANVRSTARGESPYQNPHYMAWLILE